ncbi:MAG: DUF2339 domain-containing protein [Cyclobacteriaceae bacterium]|nr:DUF2339 domain-containing protein [Cyclobacteriaceae bacterium]
MLQLLKEKWIALLGGSFIFLGFLYFLKMAIDEGWLPPVVRVCLSFAIGATVIYYGYHLYNKKQGLSAQFLAGLGIAIIYGTFGYCAFSTVVHWSSNALFIAIVSFTVAIITVSLKYELRTLLFIGLLGGLLTPFVVRAAEMHVNYLFFYLLIINLVALLAGSRKGWSEVPLMAMLVTMTIYAVYYVYFDPIHWQKPIFYISSLFLIYHSGIFITSSQRDNKFNGLFLYLGLINALYFICWSYYILMSFELAYAWPMIFTGVVFAVTGALIYLMSKGHIIPTFAYLVIGITLIAGASSEFSAHLDGGLQHVVNSFIWLVLICLAFISGKRLSMEVVSTIALAGWGVLFLYWYSVAWEVEWVSVFGIKYIPFLNPGALMWVGLAISGFYISKALLKSNQSSLARAYAIASHLVIGGLLSIQILNGWEAYGITTPGALTMLSVSWAIYALVLFYWGSVVQDKIYRLFGSVVLVITSLKVFIIDLHEADGWEYAAFLMALGGIILFIYNINKRWFLKETSKIDCNKNINS